RKSISFSTKVYTAQIISKRSGFDDSSTDTAGQDDRNEKRREHRENDTVDQRRHHEPLAGNTLYHRQRHIHCRRAARRDTRHSTKVLGDERQQKERDEYSKEIRKKRDRPQLYPSEVQNDDAGVTAPSESCRDRRAIDNGKANSEPREDAAKDAPHRHKQGDRKHSPANLCGVSQHTAVASDSNADA